MANSTTHVDTIISSQYGKEITANAYFDAASPATLYGRRASTCGGTTWGYYGGNALVNGVVTQIANGTIALIASATSYIEANPTTGAVTANSTAFTSGYIPLYSVVVGSSAITSWTDYRIGTPDMTGMLTKSLSDANTSLSASEARNEILTFSGTLTATRNIVLPLVPKQWTVYNGTGQSLQFIGATGTGVTVSTLKHAIIRSDGTNIVEVTLPAGGSVAAKDEGSTLTSTLTSLDFVGAGVTATNSGGAVTVTINGASSTMSINTQTASYTLVSGDAEKYVRMNVASANNLTVPPNSSVAFAIGTQVHVRQAGAGKTTVVAGSGVTINTPETLNLRKQQSTATLIKVATDTWEIMGDLEAA